MFVGITEDYYANLMCEVINMARKRRPLVPQARPALNQLEGEVMKNKGYQVNPQQPTDVKYKVAKEKHVPLDKGYNGDLTSHQAGKVGGEIGGNMVREMIKMAQQSMRK
jgi:hypothetical protein